VIPIDLARAQAVANITAGQDATFPSGFGSVGSGSFFERHPIVKDVAIGAAVVGGIAIALTGVGAVVEAIGAGAAAGSGVAILGSEAAVGGTGIAAVAATHATR